MKHKDTKAQRHKEGRNQRLFSAAFFVSLCLGAFVFPVNAQGRDPKIWTGVYTISQAERGKTNFTGSCARCHLADLSGGTGPSLKGERFITAWENENVYRLFIKIRDTMPPNFGTSLSEEAKLDVVSYILQNNGFPAGPNELKIDADELENIQIVRKGASNAIPNFTLVQAIGCLTPGTNNVWLLTNTTQPVPTKDQPSTPDELQKAAAGPLGSETFRLISTTAFNPALHVGQRIEAKGLLYREPNESRLNLTSLRMIGSTCSK